MNDFFLFDTLRKKKILFRSIHENYVNMYSCGPTLYNVPHIGNYRAYIFEDLLRRSLEFYGYNVIQIMNLTDVDDKTIKQSIIQKMSIKELTNKYKDQFFRDLDILNIKPANHYPHATGHIKEIIEMIDQLLSKKIAYTTEDGSIYFSIKKFKNYGKLSKIYFCNLDNNISRIDHDSYKKDCIADFALWKSKTNEDGDIFWESPWGKGRPGWHIECSAMSKKYFGNTLDIHTGGVDNIFPHHENEIAQNESTTGEKFVNYWVHCEHLLVDGNKMSKSLNNFYVLDDLLNKDVKWNEIRWVLLSTHYRNKLNFTFDSCISARKILNKFYNLFYNLNMIIKCDLRREDCNYNFIEEILNKFKIYIGNDLDISGALSILFELYKKTNNMISDGTLTSKCASYILKAFANMNSVLGTFKDEDINGINVIPSNILLLLNERNNCRDNKNFNKSDELRDELYSKGWKIEDTKYGTFLKRIEDE